MVGPSPVSSRLLSYTKIIVWWVLTVRIVTHSFESSYRMLNTLYTLQHADTSN
jgi:hypothetical protein